MEKTRLQIQIERIEEDFDKFFNQMKQQKDELIKSTFKYHIDSGMLKQDLDGINSL